MPPAWPSAPSGAPDTSSELGSRAHFSSPARSSKVRLSGSIARRSRAAGVSSRVPVKVLPFAVSRMVTVASVACARACLSSGLVLGVRHVLAPLGVAFGERQMRHGLVGCGAVPMPFVASDLNDVARPDLDDALSARLDEAFAFGDVQCLGDAVGVPGGARAGCEAHAAQRELVVAVPRGDQRDRHLSREPVGRAWHSLGLRLYVHVGSPRWSVSGTQQLLDGAALVHRPVALGGVLERQGEVEDLAGVDLLVADELDELGQKASYGSGSAVQVDAREEQLVARQ